MLFVINHEGKIDDVAINFIAKSFWHCPAIYSVENEKETKLMVKGEVLLIENLKDLAILSKRAVSFWIKSLSGK